MKKALVFGAAASGYLVATRDIHLVEVKDYPGQYSDMLVYRSSSRVSLEQWCSAVWTSAAAAPEMALLEAVGGPDSSYAERAPVRVGGDGEKSAVFRVAKSEPITTELEVLEGGTMLVYATKWKKDPEQGLLGRLAFRASLPFHLVYSRLLVLGAIHNLPRD